MGQTKEEQERQKEKVRSDEKPPNTPPGEKERERYGENPRTGEESRFSDSSEDETCGKNPETGEENC